MVIPPIPRPLAGRTTFIEFRINFDVLAPIVRPTRCRKVVVGFITPDSSDLPRGEVFHGKSLLMRNP